MKYHTALFLVFFIILTGTLTGCGRCGSNEEPFVESFRKGEIVYQKIAPEKKCIVLRYTRSGSVVMRCDTFEGAGVFVVNEYEVIKWGF